MALCKEYQKFKQFSDSLLTRSSKLTEIIAQLETLLGETGKDEQSSEGKRVSKPFSSKTCHTEVMDGIFNHNHMISYFLQWRIFSDNHGACESHNLLLRSVTALESAVEILEKQFEACESVRVEVTDLDTKTPPPNENAFLDFNCMVYFTWPSNFDMGILFT